MATLTTLVIALCAIVSVLGGRRRDASAKEELEIYIEEAKKNVDPRYRLTYHIAAPVGWINDPNGFSHYKGQFQLFYQYYPYDSKWGPMHWGHVTSTDLVFWEYRPTALLPDEEQCFSGSAVEDSGKLVLMYTAHVATDYEPFFNQSQYIAFSDDGVNFEKYSGNPVLPAAPNGNPDFRDPKVWRHEDHWYVIIGSKTDDNRGRVLLYRSHDLINWDFLNVLAESHGNMGYMWECPDFFELDGKFVLLMSPQGIEPEGDRYKNTFQTGYIVGNFDYDTFVFEPIEEFQELDFGHDFYATQTQEAFGQRFLVAWFGMWEVEYPEAVDGWAGAMTIFRRLRLTANNRIIQEPVPKLVMLREEKIFEGQLFSNSSVELGKAAEVIVYGNRYADVSILFEGKEGGGMVSLTWDSAAGKMIVDREGDVRQVDWDPKGVVSWRIYLDTSSVELFCGEGEVVFSSRVYPLGGWVMKHISGADFFTLSYSLKRGVPV